MSELKSRIIDDMKTAMKAHEKQRLGAIRLITAAIKQREVDERIELTDQDVLTILDKMAKQRRESLAQFEKAGRQDLADQESFELKLIAEYMPEPFSESEIADIVSEALTATDAASMADMGKVMAIIKPKLQGRADMGAVSRLLKSRLSGS